ncbi:hypothetical protein AOLI_G00233890 [Acnodon oligacanthus]
MECKHPVEETKAKFICKESEGECPERTYAKMQNEWQQNEGFSLYDDTSRGSLMVFFRNLTEGTYRCGVDISEFTEQYIEVNVEMKEDPCCGKIISQAGYIGETLSISCEHPPTLRASLKHFCKEDENLICQDIRAAGKYSLSDHSQPGFFTVTISNLTLRDAGVYWCGVETREGDRLLHCCSWPLRLLAHRKPPLWFCVEGFKAGIEVIELIQQSRVEVDL